ncbi:hypothetical protein Tco_1015351 [Tanacetum coccineum]|uniref:Integrase, catalytic region, zinc finger, CCHC-type, peptidase aspartic, catalytic n=1 Tax=Tanacetum coccineum TaxID=301880 RepID=A0ABQ5FKP6_9ASTR
MGKLLKEVLMIDEFSIIETNKVNHTVDMDMLKLVVEVECFGKCVDEFDKVTNSLTHGGLLGASCSSGGVACILSRRVTYTRFDRWRVAKEASCFILSSELLTSGLTYQGKANGETYFEVPSMKDISYRDTVSDVINGGTEGLRKGNGSKAKPCRATNILLKGKVLTEKLDDSYPTYLPSSLNRNKSHLPQINNHLERRSNAREHSMVTNVDDDVDDSPENDLALNVDHVFEADECDAFDSDVDEGPITQTMFMTNLTSEDRIYDEAGTSYDSNTPSEGVQSRLANKPDMIISDSVASELARYKELVGEYEKRAKKLLILTHSLRSESRTSKFKKRTKVIRNLKVLVLFVNDRSCEPYNAKDVTALIEQNDCVRVELEKVKQHYKELYDSIKITRAHTSEKTSTMLNEIESLKAQLRSKESCFTSDYVKPKVLAPGMYAIDVKPIPHPLKNNRSAHLNYISHLKESVETVREIVEEARVVKPLDNTLNYACQYTKLSQELLEYVIGTCPKSFNERDNKAPSTPVTRKKQVTFSDKPGTSSSNTQKHEVHQKVQQTNIPVIPSTGVNDSTEASGSKPRSNTKKNRILSAKKENKKEVEVHLRTNKSVWTKVNRVDSSISSKRVVINLNFESVCKNCNKCLNSASHEMCVVNILNSVNATSTVKIVLNKGKLIFEETQKLTV